MSLKIVSIASLEDHLRRGASAGTPAVVLYLGSDYATYRKLQGLMPSGWVLAETGARLNEIARTLRSDIRNADKQLAAADLPVWWLASDFADFGQYTSSLLVNVSRFVLMAEYAEKHTSVIAVTDDWAFANALWRDALNKNIRAAVPGLGGYTGRLAGLCAENIRFILRVLRAGAGCLIRDFRRLAAHRRRRRHRPLPSEAASDAEVMVLTWAYASTFPPGAALSTAPVMGRLPAILREQAGPMLTVAMTVDPHDPYPQILDAVLQSDEHPAVLEDFYGWRDLVASYAAYVAFFLFIRRGLTIGGHGVTALLRHELRRQAVSFQPARASLFMRIVRRIATTGAAPRAIVFPFENQPWEKVLCRAVHTFLPGTRAVAYLHHPLRDLHIATFSSEQEIASGAAPDHLITLGAHAARELIGAGFPPARVTVGGALRYEHMQRAVGAEPATPAPAGRPMILCVPNLELESSLELVDKVVRACSLLEDAKVTVNFHPLMDRYERTAVADTAREAARSGGIDLEISNAPAAALLPKANVVTYFDSGTCYEALLADRPVVFVHRDSGLDFNPLPDGAGPRCRTPQEIASAIAAICSDRAHPSNQADMSRILHDVLSDVAPHAIMDAVLGSRSGTHDTGSQRELDLKK